MAKQTSSKSSSGAPAKKKRTTETLTDRAAEAPAPAAAAETILKADGVAVSRDVIIKSEPTHEQIAQRAFELYQRQSAGALNDWLSAERELRS